MATDRLGGERVGKCHLHNKLLSPSLGHAPGRQLQQRKRLLEGFLLVFWGVGRTGNMPAGCKHSPGAVCLYRGTKTIYRKETKETPLLG